MSGYMVLKHSVGDGYNMLRLSDGKNVASVMKAPDGVYVLNENAAHRAWKGIGRKFANWDEALAGYKSSFMKGVISVSREWMEKKESA
jgi:hypothetical protein